MDVPDVKTGTAIPDSCKKVCCRCENSPLESELDDNHMSVFSLYEHESPRRQQGAISLDQVWFHQGLHGLDFSRRKVDVTGSASGGNSSSSTTVNAGHVGRLPTSSSSSSVVGDDNARDYITMEDLFQDIWLLTTTVVEIVMRRLLSCSLSYTNTVSAIKLYREFWC
jgi:hypothetical protein